jgi:putative peptidoglycan lipid II flippase
MMPRPGGAGAALVRATAVMSVGTALSRVTGFLRLSVMAWAIGGAESKLPDTYNLANTMPNIVYQLVLGEVLATIFVPVFVEYILTREREDAWRLSSTILNLAFVVSAIFAAITVIIAPWIIKIYAFRLPAGPERVAQEAVGTFFLRLFMPQMIFYATGAVLTGLLNAHKKFALPMFAPILNNAIVMVTFIAFRAMHGTRTPTLSALTGGEKLLLAGGTTAGVIAMTMVLWPAVLRLPGRYRLRDFDWRHPAIRKVGTLAKYSLAYVAVNQVGLWVVKALANGTRGGVAAYDTSFILYQLPYGIFAVSVFTALVPTLAEHHVRGDRAAVTRDLSLGLRTTAFVVLPAAAGFIALGHPIVRLLLQHGVFSGRSTELFADTFVLMAIGLGAYAAFQQMTRAFYAMQDTRTPWIVNSAGVAVNIATALPLYAAMGVRGLALSHALSYWYAVAHGGIALRRRLGRIDGRRLAESHARILVAAAATGAGAWAVARLVGEGIGVGGQIGQVGAGVASGLALYAILAAALRLDEARTLLRVVTGRRRAANKEGS